MKATYFLSEHSASAGQLCLNLASILAGRLVDGNKKVVEIKNELQETIKQLKSVHSDEEFKTKALKNLQQKLSNLQNGFKQESAKKPLFNTFTTICLSIALLSSAGLISFIISDPGITIEEMEVLTKKWFNLWMIIKKRFSSEKNWNSKTGNLWSALKLYLMRVNYLKVK